MQAQVVNATTYPISVTISSALALPQNRISYNITAQSGNLLFNTPTGTWTQSQLLSMRIKDNGTASTLSYASGFTYGTSLIPPFTTTVNKTQYLLWIYNGDTTRHDFISYVIL